MLGRRLIEEAFPVREVSAESAREKSIRHGHISTLHIWWARRPLASSRATNYAALIPATANARDWSRKRDFIVNLCRWKNSLNQKLIRRAIDDILKANGGKPPRVLDPFAGGGSIPLEALRLGCEVHSGDYNPVSVLILKCTLEYPQKYGKVDQRGEWAGLKGISPNNPLLEDVRKWGKWVLEKAKKKLEGFYPNESDGSVPVGYIWAHTIPCQNPSCRAEIPLIKQFLLARKSDEKVAIFPSAKDGEVTFRIVGTRYDRWPTGFDPKKGTVSRAIATCLVCGSVVEAKKTRRLFRQGKAGERMIAVVSRRRKGKGKSYRIATDADARVFSEAERHMRSKRETLSKKRDLNPVPDEPLPPKESHRAVGSQLPLYGFKTWGDLFNSRQKLAMMTFSEAVKEVHEELLERGCAKEYAKAVVSYLALGIGRLADFGSSLCVLNPTGGRGVVHAFGRQTLAMVWDYAESNPFNPFGAGWPTACKKNEKWLEHALEVSNQPATVFQSSATSLPYPDNHFDAVFTDPPYYDNVPYSYLSDYFYVWQKRIIGHLYTELFSTPLTPKSKEIVVYANRLGGKREANIFFESMLKKSFQEIHRVLKENGIATIVYAHKSTAGWESLINSLLDSQLIVTGAWPIHTERRGRLMAQETASLASSIYIVARKIKRQSVGFYNEVKEDLKRHLNTKLDNLWQEGISGSDFFIAAIGSAIEVFGKYETVMDLAGNAIRAARLLGDVRKIATDYAVRQVLHNGLEGEISDLTRLYVLWRWEFGEARVPFDDARKLAQSCGIDLSREWNRDGFIRKEKEYIRLFGPHERKIEKLEDSRELIDILHLTLLYWEKGRRDEMTQAISDSGFGQSEAFYRVAQAVSETLPNQSKEKKLLDGFLAGRERVREEVKKRTRQTRLV